MEPRKSKYVLKKEYDEGLAGKMNMVRMSVRAVTRNYAISRLITGTPGIGKSYSVRQELELEASLWKEDGKNIKYEFITGGIRDALAFYTILCDNNHKDMIIVLDDVNTVLTNKDCREILRAITVNNEVRRVAYLTSGQNRIVRGHTFYKPVIDFYSRVIIITNIPEKKIDSGILSRTNPIEIIVTPQEVFDWLGKNLKDAPPHNMPLKWKEVVYHFLKTEITVENFKRFDFRVFEDCMLWFASCVQIHKKEDGSSKYSVTDEWKTYIYTLVCK